MTIKTPDKRTTGLFHKFNITRVDGTHVEGGKHYGCDYFVLDLTHDHHALAALDAYADSCAIEYPVLSRDLKNKLDFLGYVRLPKAPR